MKMFPSFLLALLSFFALDFGSERQNVEATSNVIAIAGNKSLHRTAEFGYVNFIFHPNSKLEVENTRLFHAESYKQCLLACASKKTCFSINFGKHPIFFYQGKAQYLCEILPTDKYKSSSKYQSSHPDFDHYSILSISCSSSPCLHNFTCIPDYDNDTYECSCPRPAFEGKQCKDVDECTTGQHDCSVNADCTNTIGSFNCTCKPGYHGDGRNCTKSKILHSAILGEYGNDSYHAALMTFLEELSADMVNIPWTRCWWATNDGFDVTTSFHPKCDGKGPTVTLVRKNQYIWGGYTDIPWSSPPPGTGTVYKNSSKSFIFSLYNIHGFSPQKFKIIDTTKAVTHNAVNFGPCFGGLRDIRVDTNANTKKYNNNVPHYYAIPPGCLKYFYCNFFTGIAGRYTIDDIEVFYKNTV